MEQCQHQHAGQPLVVVIRVTPTQTSVARSNASSERSAYKRPVGGKAGPTHTGFVKMLSDESLPFDTGHHPLQALVDRRDSQRAEDIGNRLTRWWIAPDVPGQAGASESLDP